jgi:hypothetical protein
MRIIRQNKSRAQGSVFLVAIGMTALFALVIASYLTLVEGHAASVARSQRYNSAIPVAEAGVEEALSLLNKAGASAWSNNLTADGWSSMAGNTTSKSNLVSNSAYYQVTISNVPGGSPTIISTGVVPFNSYTWAVDSMTSSNNYLSSATIALMRTVQIQTTTLGLFSGAILAKGDIVFSGGANVDSFNSANPNLSGNGQYTTSKKDDKALVATDSHVVQSITGSGGVDIRGYVNTGPGGTITGSGGVSIGDNSWVSNSTVGIEASRSNDNFNVAFPDVSTPTATFVQSPASGTVSGTNYTMVFEGNQYWGASNVMYQTSFNLSGSQSAIVTGGAVTIYVPAGSSFQFSGQSYIYVAPGSSVSFYCGAASAQLSGQSLEGATNAEDVSFYGLPTCTTIQYSGNSSLIGTIYAPEANFQASGNGAIIGALMANTFTFSGNATVHYDENLANSGPSTGFVASSWQEIATPTANLTLPP